MSLFTTVNMRDTLKNNHVDCIGLIFHIIKIIETSEDGMDVSDQKFWDTGLTKALMSKFKRPLKEPVIHLNSSSLTSVVLLHFRCERFKLYFTKKSK